MHEYKENNIPSSTSTNHQSTKQATTTLLTNESQQVPYVNHSDLPDETKLSEIAMLGSHDAGTYAYSKKRNGLSSTGSKMPRAFKTQNKDLVTQAKAGARYFDIRIAQNKNGTNGTFGFFHSFSVAGDSAVSDVENLLKYAAEDKNNFYLIKFAFKGETGKTSATAASDIFLKRILENYRESLIMDNLSKVTVNSLNQGKNIWIMVDKKKYDGKDKDLYPDYDKNSYTEWADKPNAEKTANSLLNFHKSPIADKLNIIQTNMPVASRSPFELSWGVKDNLFKNKKILVIAILDILIKRRIGGIVSADYVGDANSAVPDFMEIINVHNQLLKK
ncbi:hypothetical protein BDD26_3195 [Xenorhabdus cabanillasii]|uniref:Phosphatidylinositol diacylglycerol-lyase n=1 Tax=Xenorhabdus cabanillasii TaxID=351673 RepID=A0A3D9UGB4_9GAMM|nr:hypothetical protein [Xenorhabdus cabanillasii]REF28307.1 hypothetical protein BDD26_3195 [Xenorhabdus cabanillasii]